MRLTFRNIRIAILLLILAVVSLNTWLGIQRTTDWDHPLWVVIYPLNGDGSQSSRERISSLSVKDFAPMTRFMQREAQRHGVAIKRPVTLHLADEVTTPPPATPAVDANPLQIALWSLQMRWWAWRVDSYNGPPPDIRLFVEYFAHADQDGPLENSFGLQKSRISVSRLFTSPSMRSRNLVVMTHELLHTLGATDKYDFATLQPHDPQGFADPDQQPLYPQSRAEIMAGRIALSESRVKMPASLKSCIVGPVTAREIGWSQ
ncbi:MAG: hypothetical protein ABFR19_01650 [Pseudomonadota bacterium]